MIFVFLIRVDIKNKRNRTAAEIAHNIQISNSILKCRKNSNHLDYFDLPSADKPSNHEPVFCDLTKNEHLSHNFDTKCKVSSADLGNSKTSKQDYQIKDSNKVTSLLFKAIKMGDISYISDYFGVAIDKNKYNDFESDDCDKSTWYVQDVPDNKIVDPHTSRPKDDIVNKSIQDKVLPKIDVFGQEGLTPLHVASAAGSIEVVQFLLTVGASPHIRY